MKQMKWWKRLSLLLGVFGTALLMTACSTTPKDASKVSDKPQNKVSQSSSKPDDQMGKQELKQVFVELQDQFVETIYDSTDEQFWTDVDVKLNAKENLPKLEKIQKKLEANKTEKELTGKLLELAKAIKTFYTNFINKGLKSDVATVVKLIGSIGKDEFDNFIAPSVLGLTSTQHSTHKTNKHPDAPKNESSASSK